MRVGRCTCGPGTGATAAGSPTCWTRHLARIRVPGLEADVLIQDVGTSAAKLCRHVDDTYRKKYVHIGRDAVERMVTLDAAAATLQLISEKGSCAD